MTQDTNAAMEFLLNPMKYLTKRILTNNIALYDLKAFYYY